MHLIQFREIMRDAEVAHAIHPIVLKYLLTVEETTKALLACGVSRAANVARISTGRLLNKYATNRPTKQRDLFSSDIKALNVALRFSDSSTLHPQIGPAMLSSRRSATHASRKGFDQANYG
jgi:hypothetical protein